MRSINRKSKIHEGSIALGLPNKGKYFFFYLIIIFLFSLSGCYTNLNINENEESTVMSEDKSSEEIASVSKPQDSKKQVVLKHIYTDIENNNPRKAIEKYNNFITANPEENLSEILLAQLQIYAGNITKAKKVLRNVLTQEDVLNKNDLIDAKLLLAQIFGFEKAEQEQLSLLFEVIKTDPNNSDATAFLGAFYANQGDLKKQKSFFKIL